MSDSPYLRWRRVRWTVLNVALALALAGLAMCTSGCFSPFSRPSMGDAPKSQPALAEPETPAAKVARLEGELAQAKTEHEEARLAPLRASLAWVDGIALLGMLAGIGLAIAAMFWGLGFGWKIPAGGALACGGILAASLATGWALNHVAWIIAGVGILVVAAIAWAVHRHLTLVSAARTAWQLVPDSIAAPPKVEALLERIAPSDAKGA